MITEAFAERYKDSYEAGMSLEEYVEFFQDYQKSAPEDKEFAALSEDDLRELAQRIMDMQEA